MPDESSIAQSDLTGDFIEGARRRPIGDDTANKFPREQSQQETAASSADMAISARGFTARSVRIDNLSNQWLLVGSAFDFIPPYTLGVVLNVRGISSLTVTHLAPANGVLPATILGETYAVTLYDKPQMPSGGRAIRAAISRPTALADSTFQFGANVPFVPTSDVQIVSIVAFLSTSAVVGNRFIQVQHALPDTDIAWASALAASIPASSNVIATFGQGVPYLNPVGPAGSQIASAPLPDNYIARAGDTIKVLDAAAISGADAVSLVIYGYSLS